MHKRVVIMTLAVLCGVAATMVGTFAPASGDEGRKVQFTDTSPITTFSQFMGAYIGDPSRCKFNTGFTNVVAPCVEPVDPIFEPSPGAYNDTLTGDIQGTGSFKGSAVLAAINDLPTVDVPFESYEPYSVTVTGCGTGTLLVHNEGNLGLLTGQWWIVPGSGRGGLVGISGNGTYSQTAPFTPATYIGHVRCGGHEHG